MEGKRKREILYPFYWLEKEKTALVMVALRVAIPSEGVRVAFC